MEENIKVGLEIHQQLNTGKLFCSCKSDIVERNPIVSFKRFLASIKGESGEVDKASIEESKKNKFFVYQGHSEVNCLVESDEEPIHEININAIKVAVQICKMLNAKIVDNVQIMRKIVIDGSNTSGFQRTCLIGFDGVLKCSFGNVRISSICLEEDSSKIVEKGKEFDIYNISRLGIPLVEISTYPDIFDKKNVREVAETLGNLLRSTKHVKRGLGSIRQDVNVSFNGGSRVEIKGVQDLKGLENVVDFEVERQKELLKINKDLKGKSFDVSRVFDLSDLLKNSGFKLFDGKVFGIKLKNLAGILGKKIQIGRRFGSELSDYAKVTSGVKGIIHSDEILKYVDKSFLDLIIKRFKMSENDAFVLVCAPKDVAIVALDAIAERVRLAFKYSVLEEVRNANNNYSSSFMRSISGADRMYPETDSVSFKPDLSIEVPKLNSDIVKDYIKIGLGKDLAKAVVKKELDIVLDEIIKNVKGVKESFVAESILNFLKQCEKENFDFFSISLVFFVRIFSSLVDKKISKESISIIFSDVLKKGEFRDFSKYYLLSDEEVREKIKGILKGFDGSEKVGFGLVMSKLRSKVDSDKAFELTKEFLMRNKKV